MMLAERKAAVKPTMQRSPHSLVLLLAALGVRAVCAAPPNLAAGRFRLDGQPRLVHCAYGVTRESDLPRYAETGFNTLVLTVDGAPPGQPDAADPRALAQAAEKLGLWVLVTFDPWAALFGQQPLGAGDAAGRAAVADWLARRAGEWHDLPNLLGYSLPDELEARLLWREVDFTAWLAKRYGDPLNLSVAWRRQLPGFDAASIGLASAADERTAAGFGRPALDLARWQAETVEGLLRQWTRALHAADPAHPVLGGRMSRGRTLLVAPDDLAVLQPWQGPADGPLGQADAAELVALASQAGRFGAWPCLDSGASGAALWRAVRTVCGRGVAGLGFARWADLAGDPDRRRSVRAALAEADGLRAAGFTARGGVGVVLEPFCRGPERYGRQWYGYGTFGGAEPAGLLEILRRGTAYGPLDILGARDLTRLDLGGYGALLLPAAVDLTDPQIAALVSFVDGGGVLLADFGVGCERSGGDPATMPPALAELFGVKPVKVARLLDVVLDSAARRRFLNLPPGESPFPGVPATIPPPGSFVITGETPLFPQVRAWDGSGHAVVSGLLASPATFCLPGDETLVVALQAQIPTANPLLAPAAGLFQRRSGAGSALFCSSLLWESWGPGDTLFDALHDGLLQRRPALTMLADGRGRRPSGLYAARSGDTLWLEQRGEPAAQVALDLPCSQAPVPLGGFNVVRRTPTAPTLRRQVGEPLIRRRILSLAAGELRLETPLPISVWPLEQPVGLTVTRYEPEGIDLTLYGHGEQAVEDAGTWRIDAPRPSEGILRIADGAYRITPGSQHRLTWWHTKTWEAPTKPLPDNWKFPALPGASSVQTKVRRETLMAGPDGQLVLKEWWQFDRLLLTPVEPPPPGAPG